MTPEPQPDSPDALQRVLGHQGTAQREQGMKKRKATTEATYPPNVDPFELAMIEASDANCKATAKFRVASAEVERTTEAYKESIRKALRKATGDVLRLAISLAIHYGIHYEPEFATSRDWIAFYGKESA